KVGSPLRQKVSARTGLTAEQSKYLGAELTRVAPSLKPPDSTPIQVGDKVVDGTPGKNSREGVVVAEVEMQASGPHANIRMLEVKFGNVTEEIASHSLSHAETKPKAI